MVAFPSPFASTALVPLNPLVLPTATWEDRDGEFYTVLTFPQAMDVSVPPAGNYFTGRTMNGGPVTFTWANWIDEFTCEMWDFTIPPISDPFLFDYDGTAEYWKTAEGRIYPSFTDLVVAPL